jgi:hypothetical protein
VIVTEAPGKGVGHVVLQKDHTDLALQLARAFGNQSFQPLAPRALLEFLALNHDRGWDEVDERIQRNPKTGLPYSLVNTPLAELLATGPRSIDFNARHHPYCGLLACMHIWGLFNGRYGMSDKIVVDMLQGEAKLAADAMLAEVRQREAELRARLEADPEFRAYVAPDKLMQSYKLLQLFDTLSLYFNECVGRDGEPTSFLHVPFDASRDGPLQLTPLGRKTYRLTPFPFAGKELVVRLTSYTVPILERDVDYRKVFAETPSTTETITLVAS